jgi:hypothetical protein
MGNLSRRLRRIFCGAATAGSFTLGGCVSAGGLPGRPLTPGETDMARSVFGDSVDYSKVHIYNGAPKVAGIFRLTETGLSAITPNGDIYIVEKDAQLGDLSQSSPAKRKLLIHEMTHVWQHQQGKNVEREAVFLFFKSGFKYDKAYAYDINGKQKFESLNVEQQAQMVEDYFALREMSPWEAPADRAEKIAKFEAMLKPSLPLQADSSRTSPPAAAPPPRPSAPPPPPSA